MFIYWIAKLFANTSATFPSLHLFCYSGKKAVKIEALRHWSKLQFRKFRRVFIGFHSVSYLEPWLHYLHSFSGETLQRLLYLAAAFAFWLSTTVRLASKFSRFIIWNPLWDMVFHIWELKLYSSPLRKFKYYIGCF